MRLALCLFVFGRRGGGSCGDSRIRVSSVAIRAANAHGAGRVHRGFIRFRVAGNAASGLAVGFLLRLAEQACCGIIFRGMQQRRGNPSGCGGEEQARRERKYEEEFTIAG